MTLTKGEKEKIETPKPKTRPIAWVGLVIVLFIVVMAIGFSASNNNPSSSTSSSNNPPQGICSDLASIKKQAQSINFKALDKNPDSFNGTIAKFTGQVFQIQESDSGGYMRLSVTKESYGWSLNDIIYVEYAGHSDAVKDDVVTVYGTLTGSKTYESLIHAQITIPSMTACSIEKASSKTQSPATKSPTSQPQSQPSPTPVSVPVPTSAPTAPAPTPKTWHTVITYSNNQDIKTTPFSMQGTQWRISYTCSQTDPSETTSMFYGYIYPTDSNAYSENFASFVKCPKSNTTYAYSKSPGQYYFDLSGNNVSYTVTVEDYY